MEKDVQKELEEAIRFAEESPFPTPEDALKDLYAES
jgi:TPP-dependent pyruvate/acetoin dehydrogenase alpha subunit